MEYQWPPQPNAVTRIECYEDLQLEFENEILTCRWLTWRKPKLIASLMLLPIEMAIVKGFLELWVKMISAPPQVTAAFLNNPGKVIALGAFLIVTGGIFLSVLCLIFWLMRRTLLVRFTIDLTKHTFQTENQQSYPLSHLKSLRITRSETGRLRMHILDFEVEANSKGKSRRYTVNIFREHDVAERCAQRISEFTGIGITAS